MSPTRFPRIRRDLTRLGLGIVQLVTKATTQRVHTRRVALFDELVEDGQVSVLRALIGGDATWAELEEAKRRKEHLGSSVLAGIGLHRELFPAMRATVARMGKAKSTRDRYGNTLDALEKQTIVPWPHTPMRVKDLLDVEWETLAAGWGKSAADWNHVGRFVSAFLTVYLSPPGATGKRARIGKVHPFRLQVVASIPTLDEEERVPDLSPELFARILEATPEHVRPAFMVLLLTGMRDRSEYLACTTDDLLPVTHQIRPPGKKTKKSRERQPISVSPSMWVWIEAGIPSPLRYKALHSQWQKACIAVGAGHRAEGQRYTGLRLHDLRHALGQWLSDEGRPLNDVQDVLRHATPGQSARYARRTATKRAAETIADVLNRKGA